MSYTPTVWQTGDIVSSTKLNKLENAVKDLADELDEGVPYDDSESYEDGTLGRAVSDLKSAISDITPEVLAAYPTDTASGEIVSFPDGADDIPVKGLTIDLEPYQSGSGDPSPENVRPIVGRSKINLYRTGKNIFGGDLMRDGVTGAMPSATDDPAARTVTFSANTAVSPGATIAEALYGRFKANTQYTFIMVFSATAKLSNLRVYYTDDTYANIPGASESNTKGTVIYVSAAGKTVRALNKTNQNGTTTLYYDESGIFEGVLTADDFETYRGAHVSLEIDGTIYGGTLDVPTGVLTVYPHYSSYNGETLVGPWVSSMDAYAAGTTPTSGAQVVDLRGTPQTVQLTPETLSTLLGANNIWSIPGNVDVEYRADPTLYIRKLTGPAEADMIADSSIASGQYFMVGNRLFLSTAAVAAGAQLTIGTNCVETNLAAALNAINS